MKLFIKILLAIGITICCFTAALSFYFAMYDRYNVHTTTPFQIVCAYILGISLVFMLVCITLYPKKNELL